MTHRGPFQPLLFCDSVMLFTSHTRGTHSSACNPSTRSLPPLRSPASASQHGQPFGNILRHLRVQLPVTAPSAAPCQRAQTPAASAPGRSTPCDACQQRCGGLARVCEQGTDGRHIQHLLHPRRHRTRKARTRLILSSPD